MDQLQFTISLDLLIDDLYVLREALIASPLIEAKRMLEDIDQQTDTIFYKDNINYFKRQHLREFCTFIEDSLHTEIDDWEIDDFLDQTT